LPGERSGYVRFEASMTAIESIRRVAERVSPRAAGVALAGALCFVAAFGVGRATGAEETAATPSLTRAPAASVGMALPQLSEAAPVPELAPPVRRARPVARVARQRPAARPRPAVRRQRPAPKPEPTRPASPTPVVIVGRG
jgi:hypothetical protein